MEPWELFEREIVQMFGLSTTITSGSKFFDPGDGVTRGRQDPWPLYADAKTTQNQSFSLKVKDLRAYALTAATVGKRFILPLRFWDKGTPVTEDYVVLSLHDFKELLDVAKSAMESKI